jgi:hypothetical protein
MVVYSLLIQGLSLNLRVILGSFRIRASFFLDDFLPVTGAKAGPPAWPRIQSGPSKERVLKFDMAHAMSYITAAVENMARRLIKLWLGVFDMTPPAIKQ